MRHERLAGIPWRVGGIFGDIIPLEPGDGQGGEVLDADFRGKGGIIGHNRVILGLIIIDQVHFVDGQHDVFDADEVA